MEPNMNHKKLSMKTSKAKKSQLMVLTMLSMLVGCGSDDFSDLSQYILGIKAKPKMAIEKLPEIKPVEQFSYKDEVLRDPFKPLDHPELQNNGDGSGNGLKPDFQRRKEELEAFPLDGLKMVGTVIKSKKLWGLIKASDKTVHRVQVGNYMGKNFGKIIRITTDKVELMEIVPDKPGTWREQQTSLALAE
jgi:Tfp pilus assembly protein PilP